MVKGYFKGEKHYFSCKCGMILSGNSIEHLNALIKIHELSKYHTTQLWLQENAIPKSRKQIDKYLAKKVLEDEKQEIEELSKRHSLPLKDKVILKLESMKKTMRENMKNEDSLNKSEVKK